MVVSYRAKLILLGFVLVAILYVLISPLPELAVTSTLKFPVFPLILIVLVLLAFTGSSRLLGMFGDVGTSDSHVLLARSCVMLC
jgi:uncharacterized membrane protein